MVALPAADMYRRKQEAAGCLRDTFLRNEVSSGLIGE